MLAFARRQELKAEPSDLALLVSGMADLLDRSLGSGIRILIRHTPAIGPVLVDRNQLEMALLNLAVNARDAMPAGGDLVLDVQEKTLTEGNRVGLHPGRFAVVSVIDHGEGMPPETLARATEPFSTTKGVGKGTGLGLPMVHGLAEQFGGRLELKSTLGEGTTALLWLPVISTQPAPQEPEPVKAQTDSLVSLDILAVDDDPLVLINTGAMLEDHNHRVRLAHSGREALELLESHRFDLLITDQGMPGMSGAELIDDVRKSHPNLPILLATGYAELPRGLATGVPRLAKPFSQQDLLRSVRQAMAGSSEGSAA